MRPYSKIIRLLLPSILLPLTSVADPLNGGLGSTFERNLALALVAIIVVVCGPILSIRSLNSSNETLNKTAWGFIITGKIISIALQNRIPNIIGFTYIVSLPVNIGLILLLNRSERSLIGREFLLCYIFRSTLTITVITDVLSSLTDISQFIQYTTYVYFIAGLVVLMTLLSRFLYRLLLISASKNIAPTDLRMTMLYSVVIGICVYLSQSTTFAFAYPNKFGWQPQLFRALFTGVFPYNALRLIAWVLSGAIAYNIYTAKTRQREV